MVSIWLLELKASHQHFQDKKKAEGEAGEYGLFIRRAKCFSVTPCQISTCLICSAVGPPQM